MLAGNIKRKTFIRTVSALGLSALLGYGYFTGGPFAEPGESLLSSDRGLPAAAESAYVLNAAPGEDVVIADTREAAIVESRAQRRVSSEQPQSNAVSSSVDNAPDMAREAAGVDGLVAPRNWDQVVLMMVGKDLGTDKRKDVTQGRGYKVNLYQDAGEATMNRAKVDIDRDDLWDEKWTIRGEEISLQIASSDDEVYDLTWQWNGAAWVTP